MATTPNYGGLLPTVGGSEGTWGAENNALHGLWDTEVFKAVYRDGSRAFTGPQSFAVGSAAAPGLTFTGDSNSGLFWVSADTLGVTLGGTLRATFATAGLTLTGGLTATTGTFSGRVQTPASTTGGSGLRIPPGTAPTSPVDGDVWCTAAGFFGYRAGAPFQFDAPGTGNWSTARSITFSGGDVTGATGTFDGSANVTGVALTLGADKVTTAKILDSNVTLAKIQTITSNRLLGNVSGGAAAPAQLTGAQVSPLIDLSLATVGAADVTGDGYLKIGGFYFMWGSSNSSAGDSSVTVNLPLTVGALIESSVMATPKNTAGPSANCNVEYQYVSGSTTQITFFANTHGTGSTPQGFNWFAIGVA